MTFEWDSEKARANLAKHGVRFEDAKSAFGDPFLIDIGARAVHGELRNHILGSAGSVLLLFVAHTVRHSNGEETIRLIPARKPREASEPFTIPTSFQSSKESRHHRTPTEAEGSLRKAAIANDEVDLQEMPEITQHEFKRAVRGYLPVAETQVNLWLDEEVKAWLIQENRVRESRGQPHTSARDATPA